MRSLVTGAAGHLGSYLVRRLLDEGCEVIALVREQSDLWRLSDVLGRVEVVRADLSDIKRAAPAILHTQPEAVFHLAWQGVTSDLKNSPEQLTSNVKGSLELFEIVRAAGCKFWLGTGSQAEYGAREGILTEETSVNPQTAYGVGKLCVGMLTKKLCELANVRYVWLRLLATYGPRDDEKHLIPTVIRHLLQGEHVPLTSGKQRWDYLYVEDAAEAIFRAAVAEDARGVFNLSSGRAHTIRQIVERVCDLIDPSASLGFGELPTAPDQIKHLQADITKLQAATGWAPRTSLDEGLKRTVAWARERVRLEAE